MAEDNPTLGYRRSRGRWRIWAYDSISDRAEHPAPSSPGTRAAASEERYGLAQFSKLPGGVAATDFFTVAVATWPGLVTYYIW